MTLGIAYGLCGGVGDGIIDHLGGTAFLARLCIRSIECQALGTHPEDLA
jgi:hypothetical protein